MTPPESAKMRMRALISIAANIEPEQNILTALEILASNVTLSGVSAFYRTPAIGRPEQPDYLNGVVAVETDLEPAILKNRVLRPAENTLGRVRNADKYAARPIDLDILAFGELVYNEPGLVIPDPDLRTRAFLAAGVLELEPAFVFPDTGEALADVADSAAMRELQKAHGFTSMLKEKWPL